jgi:hypothetical protein
MEWLQDRRLLLTVGGGVVALLISAAIAIAISRHGHAQATASPASVGGLVVQMGAPQDAKLDPKEPLRCFVNGQFIGMATLADCAKQNGVATKALDVGIDPNGALAAGGAPSADVAPLPPSDAPPADQNAAVDPTSQIPIAGGRGATGDCLRYGGVGWRKAGDSVTLSACVQVLFAGHCEKPGGASYGRWAGQTLRLAPHRVEISSDNVNFRPLADQSDSCAIADF